MHHFWQDRQVSKQLWAISLIAFLRMILLSEETFPEMFLLPSQNVCSLFSKPKVAMSMGH